MQEANKTCCGFLIKISYGAAELSHTYWGKWVFAKGQLEGNINEPGGNQGWLCFMKITNNLLGQCRVLMSKLCWVTCKGGNAYVLTHLLFPFKTECANWWNEIILQICTHEFISENKIKLNDEYIFLVSFLYIFKLN